MIEGRVSGAGLVLRRVRIVWSGKEGSQPSIQAVVGSKPVPEEVGVIGCIARLELLFCRENEVWLMGSFPRAFSDIPRTWAGTKSSTEEAREERP